MNITEPFYSNCFIEAIKAKIKNPHKVRIMYVPAHLNDIFCPHFMWTDGEHMYDFGALRRIKRREVFWFEGTIRRVHINSIDRHSAYIRW